MNGYTVILNSRSKYYYQTEVNYDSGGERANVKAQFFIYNIRIVAMYAVIKHEFICINATYLNFKK